MSTSSASGRSVAEPKIVPCRFFFKGGYCVKGKYCVFSHDSESNGAIRKQPKITCKFYQSDKGCHRGNACTFLHLRKSNPKSNSSSVEKKVTADLPSEPLVSTTSNQSKPEHPDDIWGFRDNQFCNNNGEYFYGACRSSPDPPKKKFSDLFADPAGVISTPRTASQSKRGKGGAKFVQKLCSFYVAGNCRYGTSCRDVHSMPSTSHTDVQKISDIAAVVVDETAIPQHDHKLEAATDSVHHGTEVDYLLKLEVEAAKSAECGICLEPIGSSLGEVAGNLGMLNNCSCTFCLDCIRSWRANLVPVKTRVRPQSLGTPDPITEMIPRSTAHVRLCPLCRCESFFVIPCLRLIKDADRKKVVVDQYMHSLSLIPCKNYLKTGFCSFGSSCFYRHVNSAGVEEVECAPRHLSHGHTESPSSDYIPTMLAAFVPGNLVES